MATIWADSGISSILRPRGYLEAGQDKCEKGFLGGVINWVDPGVGFRVKKS